MAMGVGGARIKTPGALHSCRRPAFDHFWRERDRVATSAVDAFREVSLTAAAPLLSVGRVKKLPI